MYINIQDKKEYDQSFLKYLNKRMLMIGLEYLNGKKQKLIPINAYLNAYVFQGARKPTAEQIIVSGLNNFEFKKINSKLVISINQSVKVPQYRSILLDTVCRLIDQGNMELTPFPIFTYVFRYVQENIISIYQDYSFGVAM